MRRRQRIARKEILWTLAAFFAMQGAFLIVLDVAWPGIYDKEHETRANLIDERRRENPDADLLVMVGSSRVDLDFVPEELPPLTGPEERAVLPFNYSHLAAGPRMNLVQVERLIRQGKTPRWLLLELIPGALHHEGVQATMISAGDLPTLCKFANAANVLTVFARSRLNPFFKHRLEVLDRFAQPLSSMVGWQDRIKLRHLGGDDNWIRKDHFPQEMLDKLSLHARSIYFDRLQNFQIDPALDGATRELLALCRRHGVHATIILTPEDSAFRSWYSAQTHRRIDEYLAGIRREFGVEVVDARAWISDDKYFDAHHLRLTGAIEFTHRLHREVIEPLLDPARSASMRATSR